MEVSEEPRNATIPTTFHPQFDKKGPGDAILIAVDDPKPTGHYFRLSLLAELSNFFGTLPTPDSRDVVGGTPLIPLHGITSRGLSTYLLAIRSTSSSEPLVLDREDGADGMREVVEAAVVGALYQTPIISRLLVGGFREGRDGSDDIIIEFILWAIGKVEAKLPDLAYLSVLETADLTNIPVDIQELLKIHIPAQWIQLQDLHIRSLSAIRKFRHRVLMGHPSALPITEHADCPMGQTAHQVLGDVQEVLLKLEDVRGVRKYWSEHYGLECQICLTNCHRQFYYPVEWLGKFAYDYVFVE